MVIAAIAGNPFYAIISLICWYYEPGSGNLM